MSWLYLRARIIGSKPLGLFTFATFGIENMPTFWALDARKPLRTFVESGFTLESRGGPHHHRHTQRLLAALAEYSLLRRKVVLFRRQRSDAMGKG